MPFIVCEVVAVEDVSGKKLRKLTVNVGDGSEGVTVVTNAPNVRLGTRTVLATIGTDITLNGEDITVSKANVGGIWSEGMICDSVMLGWAGGAAGIAVQVPPSFALGAEAPKHKPRMDGGGGSAAEAEPELSAKELKAQQKAEKKAALAAKKEARQAAKKAATSSSGEASTDAGAIEGEVATTCNTASPDTGAGAAIIS